MSDSTLFDKSLRQNKLLSQGFFVNRPAALIVILSSGISLASFLYFYLHHQTLAYHDARAHLQIARQVVAGLPKGFSQLGGIWLPLQHLLMLPTIWVDFFYYSGLSGSLISMLAYVLASVFLLKIGKLIFQDSVAAFIATLVFMLNPNLLYLQSAPMTESLLIFTFLASLYYFLKWNRYFRHRDLIFAASWAFLATLTRYDGWFLVICEAKLFTLEYSFWVDLLLPGLVVISAPTPLGGTSNHFVTAVLKELSGWDAYNVTEDCDMGVRLKRAGYEVDMIDSVLSSGVYFGFTYLPVPHSSKACSQVPFCISAPSVCSAVILLSCIFSFAPH